MLRPRSVSRRRCLFGWLALLFCSLRPLASVNAEAIEIFVSPSGNDQASGTITQPFATLERARDEVRKRKSSAADGVTVWLRGGVYLISKTVRFTSEDSGTESSPVVYRAYQSERVALIGGRTIADWKPWKGRILRADLAAQGLQGTSFRQLFCAGQRQHLARYPNFDAENPYGGGWAYADGQPVPMYQDVPGESKRTLHCKPTDVRAWAQLADVEVFVFPRYNWWNNIVRVQSIDPATRVLTLAADCSYAIRPGDRYYFQNALEELDAPGEWFLDARIGTLYFWPPDKLAGKTVYVPTVPTVLVFDKTEHLTVRGVTIECSENSAVEFKDARHCLLAGCTVRNAGHYGGSGVTVAGGQHNGVVGCDIHHVGRDGIYLGGGDRKTLTPAENYADNNYIHHTGVFYKQGVGIALNGVGNRASHNLIHDAPRMGILFSGNNLVLEYNHIRHVNLETEDTGAVYTGGRDWISSRGSVVRYNYFHDILGYGKDASGRWVSPHFAWGVYLDDNTGGVDVIGNIIARCSRAGLHLHNGRDNHIENNILVENGLQQFEYSGWTSDHAFWKSHFDSMVAGYESVAKEPAWRSLRNMELPPSGAVLPDGTIMSGNLFRRNIVAWRADSKLVALRNVSFEHNVFDRNLYFHFGRPLLTGVQAYGRDLSEDLAPNGDFEQGAPNQLPQDWQWQIRPMPNAVAGIDGTQPARGERALRIDAAWNADKPRDNYPIVVSRELELKLGASYRLRARFRATAPDASAKLMLQSYVANAYFWANWPHDVRVGDAWTLAEFAFRTPRPGEKGHHPQMKMFRLRVDFPDKRGALFVDDVQLHEVEALDEWDSWRKLGNDAASIIADPQFENYERDDFRLKDHSPAWKLGFEPIPVDRIGPYASELRASWPIVEAEGAREKPLTTLAGPPSE